MDYYKKKFKSKINENFTDMLDEVESKWTDMQPKIQEHAGDQSRVQRQLSEIRTYIEHCQDVEEKVSDDQKQRIRDIIRKCKEVLAKYEEVNTNTVKSPRTIRKNIFMETSSDPVLPQNKVALVEVEEKLKSMRQRRLDRLSVFVAEQSKLSEERSNKNNEIENAIKSIKQTVVEKKSSFSSIVEENVTEKTRTVDIPTVKRHSSGSSDKSKSSSTKKFINKFNCTTTQTVGSSNEDLTRDVDGKDTYNSNYYKTVDSKLETASQTGDEKQDYFKTHSISKNRSVFQNDKEAKETTNEVQSNYSPLLSPVGKQRKAIYFYDNECNFLENEKQPSSFGVRAIEKSSNQEHILKNVDIKPKGKIAHIYENRDIVAKNASEKAPRVLTTFGKTNQDNLSKKLDVERLDGYAFENRALIDKNESEKSQGDLTFGKPNQDETGKMADAESKPKIGRVYENREIFDKNVIKSKPVLTTFGKNKSVDQTLGLQSNPVGKNEIDKTETSERSSGVNIIKQSDNDNGTKNTQKLSGMPENIRFKPKKSNSLTKLSTKSETKPSRRSIENVYTPRSPLRSLAPLQKKSIHGERVLKKLQRNWDSLNEIMENDSDVDCDEIEDLRKTWEEANTLLGQYKARIETLERKAKADNGKLKEINMQLEELVEAVNTFKGLKRDSSYKQLSSRLSNCFLVVNKIHCSKADILNEKQMILSEIQKYIKLLENKVNRNEDILLEILEDQVKSIGTRYLNMTKV